MAFVWIVGASNLCSDTRGQLSCQLSIYTLKNCKNSPKGVILGLAPFRAKLAVIKDAILGQQIKVNQIQLTNISN